MFSYIMQKQYSPETSGISLEPARTPQEVYDRAKHPEPKEQEKTLDLYMPVIERYHAMRL